MDDSTDWTPKKWWPVFFARFAETGIVRLAYQAARVSRSLVYAYRKNSPEFATLWEEAERQAIGTLEDMATQRALKTSDTLLIFLLKTRAREKYGDHLTIDLDAEIAQLMAELAAQGKAGSEG